MSIEQLKIESRRLMAPAPVAAGHANVAAAISAALFARGQRDGRQGRPVVSSSMQYASGYRIGKAVRELHQA